jgi:hypothetical protein
MSERECGGMRRSGREGGCVRREGTDGGDIRTEAKKKVATPLDEKRVDVNQGSHRDRAMEENSLGNGRTSAVNVADMRRH